ncbi:MAG: NADH-quinone oxidoreductase subunit J [Chloroflexi bacterium]|mgnify:CR=1 FL=1|jgi:NADH-quinone oxidoreductase subunit J|nr:NADH-quinone oxidoreductase subunit J [Chloroflexota bacterium]
MTPVQLVFILVAATTLGAALMVVITRNLIHAALWLVLSLFGIAVMYVLLSAPFLAVAQVVIYIGAIAILMIFAIMLTRRSTSEEGPALNANWGWGALLGVVTLGGLVWVLSSWPGFFAAPAPFPEGTDPLLTLGQALVSPNGYVLPFELASVLLLAALIGAIVVAWDRR